MVSENEGSTATFQHWLLRTLDEIGLITLWNSPHDVKLLCLQRFVRLFAYGTSTLVLIAYLAALNISSSQIGLFMSLTLCGDVLISLLLTLIADRLGRRKVLALGAALMIGSGIAFALSSNYWILLTAAVLGVITPSGNEIGPFRAIEESTLAHLTPMKHHPTIFAWYALIGTAGSALGLVACGWTITTLTTSKSWELVDAYRAVFLSYAAVGVVKLILSLVLSKQCELENNTNKDSEIAPLLPRSAPGKKSKGILPRLSNESRFILVQLCILFALDNFASGLAPLSWVTNYFHRRFQLPESLIGTLFFITSLISAGSILVAAFVAKCIGNVRTMVFTHLPSAVCLALIGIPSQLPIAIILVVLRACTQSMDSAPRSAFLSAIVLPHERTAVMGTINVVKTLSQSFGPLVTGILAEKGLFWTAFLAAGSLKATYDIGLLLLFANHKPREERSTDQERQH